MTEKAQPLWGIKWNDGWISPRYSEEAARAEAARFTYPFPNGEWVIALMRRKGITEEWQEVPRDD